jgi:sulfhydrogenase subunit beta (sulfur reductase)
LPKDAFLHLLDALRAGYRLIGPVRAGDQTVFREVESAKNLSMDYASTMAPPVKTYLFPPREEVLHFGLSGQEISQGISMEEPPQASGRCLMVGVHPCDINATLYLDKTLMTDPRYRKRRQEAVLVALNCTRVSPFCFCSSVGAGPYLSAQAGYDALLTDLGEDYLLEVKSERGAQIFKLEGREAGPAAWRLKQEQEKALLGAFTKHIEVRGLDRLFLENADHPVWSRTAEERCLSCANCVMVCPTCFCHDIYDEVDMGLKVIKRLRRWDACQDLRFAEVHGGNFRRTRAARLRQFVTHKLDYTAQYGTAGTVGCGRCIKWCPTGIDLTEMAKEIERSPGGKPAAAR